MPILNRGRSKGNSESAEERFEGSGEEWRVKLVGEEWVSGPRGDQMAQQAMRQAKLARQASKTHKPRCALHIAMSGLHLKQTDKLLSLGLWSVSQVSFVARDPSDQRTFGFVVTASDGPKPHKLVVLKSERPADLCVLAIRDMFHAVFMHNKRKQQEKENCPQDEQQMNEAVVSNLLDLNFDFDTPSAVGCVPTDNCTGGAGGLFEDSLPELFPGGDAFSSAVVQNEQLHAGSATQSLFSQVSANGLAGGEPFLVAPLPSACAVLPRPHGAGSGLSSVLPPPPATASPVARTADRRQLQPRSQADAPLHGLLSPPSSQPSPTAAVAFSVQQPSSWSSTPPLAASSPGNPFLPSSSPSSADITGNKFLSPSQGLVTPAVAIRNGGGAVFGCDAFSSSPIAATPPRSMGTPLSNGSSAVTIRPFDNPVFGAGQLQVFGPHFDHLTPNSSKASLSSMDLNGVNSCHSNGQLQFGDVQAGANKLTFPAKLSNGEAPPPLPARCFQREQIGVDWGFKDLVDVNSLLGMQNRAANAFRKPSKPSINQLRTALPNQDPFDDAFFVNN